MKCVKFGLALGLPAEMINRHPFPGPGLGVRVLGEVKKEYADLLRQADDIFIQELRNTTDENGTSWYDLTSQAFAVFLPVKSVGVMGDGRTYDYVVALRAVITQRLHDRTLGRTAVLAARPRVQPHHQRSQRHQPRGVRCKRQTARHD